MNDTPQNNGETNQASHRWIVFFAVLSLFVGAVDMQQITPLIALLSRELGTTPGNTGHLVTGYAIASGLATPLLAPFVARYGTVALLKVGLVVLAVAELVCAAAPDYAVLMAGRMMAGVGAGLEMTLCHVYVVQTLPSDKRGWAVGWLTAGFFMASIVGMPVTSAIADVVSWRAAFTITFIAVVICIVTVRKMPHGVRGERFNLGEYVHLLRRPGVKWGLSIFGCYGIGFTAVVTYFSPWVEEAFGISTTIVGVIFMIGGIAAVLTAPPGGKIADRIGRAPVAFTANIFLALCFLLLTLQPIISSVIVLYAASSVIASWRFNATIAALSELVPPHLRGPVLLLNNTTILAGMAIGASFGGIIYEWKGYFATTVAACIITLLASIMIFIISSKMTDTNESTSHTG